MTDFDISHEFEPDAPLWVRLVLLAFGNALAMFLLCALVLSLEYPAGGVIFLVGLLALPACAAAVAAKSSARSRPIPLSAHAAAGYFALLYAFGLAIELGLLIALVAIFWNPGQLGA